MESPRIYAYWLKIIQSVSWNAKLGNNLSQNEVWKAYPFSTCIYLIILAIKNFLINWLEFYEFFQFTNQLQRFVKIFYILYKLCS